MDKITKDARMKKQLLFIAFAVAMVAAALTGTINLFSAYVAIFAVGALLTAGSRQFACSNVAGFLGQSTADTNDAVGEWQQHVLRRHGKGMNTGSTLFALMSTLPNENADAQVYNWWEKDPVRRTFYANAAFNDSVTTLTFDDNGSTPDTTVYVFLSAGAILWNYRTGERVRVTATPTTTSVTVTRGVQGTTAAAVNDNDVWILVTLAKANGAVPVRSVYTQPTSYQNYIQTFNKTASIENAYKAGILRTDIDGPKMEAQIDALEQIAKDIEEAYFFGVKELATLSEGATYYTGGIKSAVDAANAISGNTNSLNGRTTTGVTLDAFNSWVQSFMQVGSDTKIAFCGPNAYAAVSKFANSNEGGYRIMQSGENVFGLNITTIVTPFGELSLAAHPMFQEITSLSGWMFALDLKHIVQKTMEPLFFQEFEPTNGADSWQGQFRAKLGLKLKNPEAFGYAYDLQKINA